MPQQETPLPPALAQYQGLVRYVQNDGPNRFSSSCPKCGGEIHSEPGENYGDWPDRCVWFMADDPPRGYCFKCHKLFWPDQAPGYRPPTADDMRMWQRKREDELEHKIQKAAESLEKLRSSRFWEQYHQHLTDEARKWWFKRGLSMFWQDFWQLGWDDEHRMIHRQQQYVLPVATIPLFGFDWSFRNMKLRLVTPPEGVSKYRYFVSGQPAPLFYCDPEQPICGHVYAVEGEIKAMVTFATLGDGKRTMVGMPGTNPPEACIESLKLADRVTLVMDPGAHKQGIELAKKIGVKKCWLLIPPEKIDDGILSAKLSANDLALALNTATRLDAWVTGSAA